MKDTDRLKVLQAFVNGSMVQSKLIEPTSIDNKWYDDENPTWNFEKFDYRIVKHIHEEGFIAMSGFVLNNNKKILLPEDIMEKLEFKERYVIKIYNSKKYKGLK